MQPVDAFDLKRLGADAADLRAHRDEQIAQVDDLGLARGIFDAAAALGQHRRHHDIFGRADRDDREGIFAARQTPARRDRLDIARRHFELRADRLQRLQMQIDRAIADRAAARQRHGRLACAPDQRAQHQNRRAHFAHDVIRCFGRGQLARADRHHPTEILGPRALDPSRATELVEQMPEAVDIGQTRQVAQRHRLLGQQRARHQRERGVLGTGDGETARQAIAAANENTIHGSRLSPRTARASTIAELRRDAQERPAKSGLFQHAL
ncbi:hypothetical protein D9M73_90300 [compost metagenome]